MTGLPACLLEKIPAPSLLPSHLTGHASLLDTGPLSDPTLPSYVPGRVYGGVLLDVVIVVPEPGRGAMSDCEV